MKQYTDKIKLFHDIHSAVIDIDWETKINWQCASNLLSKLYFRLQNSRNCEEANICINLYLSSLSVYFNIIDTWLTEGRLEDWRDEFIIFRNEE